MNRKLIAFVLIVFIGIQSGALMVHKVKANGTIYIRADGSIDPPTAPVQRNGDTYTLTGNITGNPSGIVIERDDVILNGGGCRLQAIEGARRDPYGVGVNLLNRDNVTILNMEIKSFGFGIFLSHSNGTNISGNNITNSGYEGVYLEDSYRNIISGNSITGSDFHGLAIQASSWNSVSENNIENNGEGIALAYTGDRMGGNDISRNNVANNSGIGISVYLCLGTLSGNNITNNHVGIALWGYYVVMRNNSIVGNTYSFYIGPGPENEYWNDVDVSNTVNGKPVYYWFDEHDRQVPLDAGSVFLVNCSNITVQDLNLTNNWQGIFLVLTHDSLIAHNNFANNYYGVALLESVNNRFWGNTITDNSNGIDFSWSNSNTFYHNNFVNNTHQVSSYDGSSNGGFQDVWDDGYPSGGNYWDNYQGPDNLRGPFQNETGSDGIGDVPYVIDANNTDRYPLMPPLNLTRKTSILLNVCSVLSGSRFGIVPVRTEYTNLDDAVYPSVCIPANKSMTVSFDGWFDDYEGKSLDGKEVKLLIDDMSVSWVLSSNQSHNLNWSVAFELPAGLHRGELKFEGDGQYDASSFRFSVLAYVNSGFNITKDAYSFSNWNFSLDEFVALGKEFINRSMLEQALEIVFVASYPLATLGGHCFGMAASSSAYRLNSSLKPEPSLDTYALSLNDVAWDIDWYHLSQISWLFSTTSIASSLNRTEALIDSGTPVILGMKNIHHAVTIIGYSENANVTYLAVYDNNMPNSTYVCTVKDGKLMYGQASMDSAVFIDPSDLPKELNVTELLIELYKKYVGLQFHSPVDVNITSTSGKQLIIENNTVIRNDFADSYVYLDESKMILLPSSENCTMEATGTSDGQMSIDCFFMSGDQIVVHQSQNITISNGSKLYLSSIQSSTLSLDSNGDGIMDQTITIPEFPSIFVFLPLMISMIIAIGVRRIRRES